MSEPHRGSLSWGRSARLWRVLSTNCLLYGVGMVAVSPLFSGFSSYTIEYYAHNCGGRRKNVSPGLMFWSGGLYHSVVFGVR